MFHLPITGSWTGSHWGASASDGPKPGIRVLRHQGSGCWWKNHGVIIGFDEDIRLLMKLPWLGLQGSYRRTFPEEALPTECTTELKVRRTLGGAQFTSTRKGVCAASVRHFLLGIQKQTFVSMWSTSDWPNNCSMCTFTAIAAKVQWWCMDSYRTSSELSDHWRWAFSRTHCWKWSLM